jgi:hypothetical protein
MKQALSRSRAQKKTLHGARENEMRNPLAAWNSSRIEMAFEK